MFEGTRKKAEDMPPRRRWVAFAYLMVAEFFYGWSWNTVDVLRPQIREALGLSLTEAGSIYTAQSIGALVGAIILGQVADHRGRRQTLFFVIIGYALFGGLGAFVSSYPLLLAQRFGLGVFLGAITPVLIATYMGLFPDSIRGKLAALGLGTYNLSVILLGQAYRYFGDGNDWHLLLLGGAVPALIIAPLIFLFVPDDRKMTAWGADAAHVKISKLPILELFTPQFRRTTCLLFLLFGLNFFAYQAFAGWVTTFLKDVKGYDVDLAGSIISWQFIGAVLGGFFWGWFSDRFGRRLSAAGFFIGALSVLLYIGVFGTPETLKWTGALWGFAISASVAGAPWLSVLYPAHLRSTAFSIFNWGRIISMTAPLMTGAIADAFGLMAAMLTSAIGFALCGVVWLMLPETVDRSNLISRP